MKFPVSASDARLDDCVYKIAPLKATLRKTQRDNSTAIRIIRRNAASSNTGFIFHNIYLFSGTEYNNKQART
jgi:hypothetical protein